VRKKSLRFAVEHKIFFPQRKALRASGLELQRHATRWFWEPERTMGITFLTERCVVVKKKKVCLYTNEANVTL